MLKNILNLDGVSSLNKNEQSVIKGSGSGCKTNCYCADGSQAFMACQNKRLYAYCAGEAPQYLGPCD